MYIVQGQQAQAEYLVGDEEVPDVGTAESHAGGAIAVGGKRSRIGAILRPLDVETSVAHEYRSIAAHARWCDAVEQIDAAPDRFDQILGEPDPHQVAWMRFWQR